MTSFPQILNTHPSATWESAKLDLRAYLQRIDYQGSLAPTLPTLRALTRAHLDAISFENLDIIAGESIDIDLLQVQEKLVSQGRGGYCHEHNTLFAAVLERLGFAVAGRSARILMGTSEQEMTAIGHTLLNVDLDGSNWLVDVGVGNVGPREPIELKAWNQVMQDAWRYRLDRVAHHWVLRYWRHDGWFNIYQFSDEPYYRDDFAHHNYYVSTHPDSPFTQQMVAQYNGATIRYALTGLRLKTFLPNQLVQEQLIAAEELPGILQTLFRLNITEDFCAKLVSSITR
ncbi:arylamine N-acetyltransferase family protein [Halopseudomonas pelagia]|uniref:arylamine N-acetyltransferase family protein n=1 Tax=Halopseudomonas pelagia TaxID=553151 RepID=UPI0030D8ADB9|tara:strand:+ start:131 stop:988 length:858 start_codon:yes stop_codon:yes gene_type:complete